MPLPTWHLADLHPRERQPLATKRRASAGVGSDALVKRANVELQPSAL